MSIVVINTKESSSKISGITDKHIQQAAVDISLERVWRMSGVFVLDEQGKKPVHTEEVFPDNDGYYTLPIGSYEISFDHDIEIGPNEAALVIPRSTLVRNGVMLASGIWDPGFKGRGGCCMHVLGAPMRIKPGTRIAQFVLWKVLNSQGSYDGSYGLDKNGIPKKDEEKYHS